MLRFKVNTKWSYGFFPIDNELRKKNCINSNTKKLGISLIRKNKGK